MNEATDVAIIGAGPYGLSLAAHLSALGVAHRIFGRPMQGWIDGTPAGMLLKSEGFASNLSDPADENTLKRFCSARGLPYADLGMPVEREVFIAYGLDFAKRLVPHLEEKLVASVEPERDAFHLRGEDGEAVVARRVIVAVGLAPFAYLPPPFSSLPADRRSHSIDVPEPKRFAGRDVMVVGGGASAIDLAALLCEAGATVTLAARRQQLEIHTKMQLPRPWSDQLRAPLSGIGPSWRSRLFCEFPHLFRHLPAKKRLHIVTHHLGPAAGWFMKERVEKKFRMLLGFRRVAVDGTRMPLRLTFETADAMQTLTAEHVIAATGYRIELDRLTFLAAPTRHALATAGGAPDLSSQFQSSIPGLFFIGPAAANCFGPVMRFTFGARFTARRLSRYLRRTADRRSLNLSPPLVRGAGAPNDRQFSGYRAS